MDEAPYNPEVTYFAKTNFRDHDTVFGIKRKDRRQHMYVLGKSGTGKSAMLTNMIIQDIRNGQGVCVVDPHGELVEGILETIPSSRLSDVIYFNPADIDYHIGFNVLELEDPKHKHLVASGLMGIFTKIWANAWSARMEYILNNAILALLDTPGSTLLGIPRLLTDKDYRQKIIANVSDPVVRAFWIHEYEAWQDRFRNEAIAPIQNKVGQFLSTALIRNIVGQSKSTINVFDIMNSGKIFLVNVSKGRIGEDNSALLGGMLITKIQLAAMERVRIPENQRRDFYLYVDEFQNFVTESFASILSEARKYRLCLIMAHQYIAQLEADGSKSVRDAVFGNAGTMIIFRVGAADADNLEDEFDPEFGVQDFVMLPNYHIYLKLMVDGVTTRPFSAKTLPPFKTNQDPEAKEIIIQSSRDLYNRPRTTVEQEINKWSGMIGGSDDEKPGEGKFEAACSVCGKTTYVPFEPIDGLPIYCKEHLVKVKTGEIEPVKPQKVKKQKVMRSFEDLSVLGIEFEHKSIPKKEKRSSGKNSDARKDDGKTKFSRDSKSLGKGKSSAKKPHTRASKPTPVTKKFEPKSFKKQPVDKAGLQNLLQKAMGDTSKTVTKPGITTKPTGPTSQVPKTTPAPPLKKPAISLDSLKPPTSTKKPTMARKASTDSKSDLQSLLGSIKTKNQNSTGKVVAPATKPGNVIKPSSIGKPMTASPVSKSPTLATNPLVKPITPKPQSGNFKTFAPNTTPSAKKPLTPATKPQNPIAPKFAPPKPPHSAPKSAQQAPKPKPLGNLVAKTNPSVPNTKTPQINKPTPPAGPGSVSARQPMPGKPNMPAFQPPVVKKSPVQPYKSQPASPKPNPVIQSKPAPASPTPTPSPLPTRKPAPHAGQTNVKPSVKSPYQPSTSSHVSKQAQNTPPQEPANAPYAIPEASQEIPEHVLRRILQD